MQYLLLGNLQAEPPSNPPGEYVYVYVDSAGALTTKDSAGTVTVLAGPTDFIGLADTPATFAGQGGKLLAVNSTPDAVEFVELGAKIAAATEKATLADADKFPESDSAASGVLKWISGANLKAQLKAYFDTLYLVLAGSVAQTVTGIKTFSTRIDLPILRANSAAGLRLEDDGGNLGVFVEDGGNVGFGTALPGARTEIKDAATTAAIVLKVAQDNDDVYGLTISNTGIASQAATDGIQIIQQNGGAGWVQVDAGGGTPQNLILQANGGFVGMGILPQSKLHAHDGTAGHMIVSKTGVNATPQTLILNGTGDVLYGVRLRGIARDVTGSATYSFDQSVTNGASGAEIGFGGEGITFSVSALGALTVVRTSGTHTWTVGVDCVWL